MSFFPVMNQQRTVPGFGSKDAKIVIVGDYTSAFDDMAMRPFQGTGGQVLEQCLHLAGLIRGEVYLTNCIKSKPLKRANAYSKNGPCPEFFLEGKGQFTDAGKAHVAQLYKEIDEINPNVILACGKAASVALCGVAHVATKRGYVYPSVGLKRMTKVIPTHHPAQAVRGMFTYRHMITNDLKKARVESAFPELIRPERNLVYSFNHVDEAVAWIEYLYKQPKISVDIEVINFEVSCINLSASPDVGVVIPIADRWTLEEELVIWRKLAWLLENDSVKILQNAIFDIQFMLSRYGIFMKGEIRDTMIGHSCMYPELPKGLGFLGSIYCGAQQYWKDMVKFDDIKDNS